MAVRLPTGPSTFNLQEVKIYVGLVGGGLLWTTEAFSTLKPATSPRFSAIQLKFIDPLSGMPTPIEAIEDDIQRIRDEGTRIRRVFGGAVNVSMLWAVQFP